MCLKEAAEDTGIHFSANLDLKQKFLKNVCIHISRGQCFSFGRKMMNCGQIVARQGCHICVLAEGFSVEMPV